MLGRSLLSHVDFPGGRQQLQLPSELNPSDLLSILKVIGASCELLLLVLYCRCVWRNRLCITNLTEYHPFLIVRNCASVVECCRCEDFTKLKGSYLWGLFNWLPPTHTCIHSSRTCHPRNCLTASRLQRPNDCPVGIHILRQCSVQLRHAVPVFVAEPPQLFPPGRAGGWGYGRGKWRRGRR